MIGPIGRCQSSRRCKVTSTLSSTAWAVASSAVPRSCGEGPLNSATMAGPPGYPGPVMPGQVKLTQSRDGEAAPAASPFACPLPAGTTPASEPTAHADKPRPTIRSPSPARRRFDRREILRITGDVIGPARGLRVGGKRRRSCEQQRDRKGERDLRISFLLEVVRDVPHLAVPRRPFYRARSFGPREYRGFSVKLELISQPLRAEVISSRVSRRLCDLTSGANTSDATSPNARPGGDTAHALLRRRQRGRIFSSHSHAFCRHRQW